MNFWNNVVLRDPLQSVDSVDRGTYAMEFLKHILLIQSGENNGF